MRRIHRTRRDWVADVALFLFAACFAAVSSQSVPVPEDLDPVWRDVDQVVGGLGCAATLLRRRWPVPLAVALLLVGTWAHYLTGPAMVAVFTVAATRPWRVTAWVVALAFAPLPVFLWRVAELSEERAGSALTYFALIAGAIGWGLFRRSRQQLIASLRERAELAEAGAELRAEWARRETREEIAREMHDVLGHRLSMLSVHAGALEFNPDASRTEIARAAGVIRESAHLALRDLREVIGVLRAGPEEGERPQPELADLARLVAEARATGGRIELTGPPDGPVPPPLVGRTAYRIVQEALTNARKHAPGAAVAVEVSGDPAGRLAVEVRNAPPPGPAPVSGAGESAGAGGGQGLIGLAERARLAGGELTAGPADGGFRVRAWLPWPTTDIAPTARTGSGGQDGE
ncbi:MULTISPECIES: sensor histidine kinase [unclassified Streptosporangium]|uniref:sensor histidine kinase n=1 Tax=unclassified Streptosporangium TaxID=2632669 RepID=UPI002E2B95F7|nr:MULTISPECIES: histidine kinase [unclassified Streptosporangium]